MRALRTTDRNQSSASLKSGILNEGRRGVVRSEISGVRALRRVERSQSSASIRLNRAIAACGLCSRRAADKLIADRQVQVNGKTVTDFNLLVNLKKDRLQVGEKRISASTHEYIILHKPGSIISTCQDEFKRKNVLDLLPANLRHLKPAGRLDYDSSGLMLLTNDGTLINKLTHPTGEIEKIYQVTVAGKVKPEAIAELASGVDLKHSKTKRARVRILKTNQKESLIEIAIKEGKNRQIRRMCAQLGLPVIALVRTGVSKLQLTNLPEGKWRHLTKSELTDLKKELKIDPRL